MENEYEIINHIKQGYIQYSELSEKMKQIKTVIFAAIDKDIDNVYNLPIKCYKNFDIVIYIVKKNCKLLKHPQIFKHFIQNYYIVLAAVLQNGMALRIVYDYEIEYNDEYETICEGRRLHKIFLEREIISTAKENLINNYNIVKAAVSQDGRALEYVSERLKESKEIVKIAIENHGSLFDAPRHIRQDKELITIAIKYNPDEIYKVDIPWDIRHIFITFKNDSYDKQMEYLYENISNCTLLPHPEIWLSLISYNQRQELHDWINSNIYNLKNLFDVSFYNHKNKIGYYKGIPEIILSYMVSKPEILKIQKIIMKKILSVLDTFS